MKDQGDSWHKQMYDKEFIRTQIGAERFVKLARSEVSFIADILDLKPGSRILDVPCGAGRHSAELARRGFRVTGLDINNDCLAASRKLCKGLDVTLKQADMTDLSHFEGQFDATLNLFSSFGYFSTDQKNKAVMKQLVSTVKPKGKVVIHLINRDWLMTVFRPVQWTNEKNTLTLEGRQYDEKTKYVESHRVFMDRRTGKAKDNYHRMRIYSKSEMVALMKECGLGRIQVFGDMNGGKFEKLKSTHPIYIGESR